MSPKRISNNRVSLGKIIETGPRISDASFSNLSALQVPKMPATTTNSKGPVVKQLRFADEVEMNEISRLKGSILDELFYCSQDLLNFRYESLLDARMNIEDYE